ncbi:unnamed protein product [Zymoseptoria tritici ST99CH_3D7]|uniref:Uncharacterized protein n=1 Tax=Zymoseptoria tritici (strain ST99CH_3D7) TaxID=1276538 RepID=A0A1X7RQQ7_ZYMT9|nr:unnamed protein product [Zymoseptoria tritici ST99CH_3D7]
MISVALLLAAVGLTQAVPFKSALEKRQSLAQFNDVDILNYALTLEHLEDKFYREGLANFTQAQFAAAGFDATFYRYLQEIFTLASPFIVSCPSDNPTFPVRAYPKLVLTSTGPVTVGSKITVSTPGYVLAPVTGSNAPLFASFASAGGPVNAELTRMGNGMDYSITIPEGVAGLNYLRLSNCGDATHLSEDQILAGPVVVEITKA